MDKIVSYDQVQNMIWQIRSLRSGLVTNFYWDDNKHPYWIAEGALRYDAKQESILLIHRAEVFSNLYYISTDMDKALQHLSELDVDTDVVVDVVTKGDNKDSVDLFEKCGFKAYKHLFRMTHAGLMPVDDWDVNQEVRSAHKDDLDAISKALSLGFDPLAEQLPSIQELSGYIDKDGILLIKDQENICGFIIYEIVGVTWYLRYWYVSPDHRNLGVGAKLLKASLIKGKETKRQILWVMSHNENAIKRYEHYGFKRELMNDYVLVKRK